MMSIRSRGIPIKLLVLGCVLLLGACSSQTGQRAAQGGTMGAVAGFDRKRSQDRFRDPG